MLLKKINVITFIFPLLCTVSLAAEDQGQVVPHLDLLAVNSSLISTPPVTARTRAEHEKVYSEFYQLLDSEQFIEELSVVVKQGSLASTLFRPNENGNGVDLFFAVIDDVIKGKSSAKVRFGVQKHIIDRLLNIWETMECTSTVFIAKAIKSVAEIIAEARSGNAERYIHASSYIDGTIKNLLTFIEFLERYKGFISGLMRSQKEIYLLLASKKTLTPSEINRPTSISNRVSQCDFSVERLLREFKDQVNQVYLLRNLLPQVQVEAEKLFADLRGSSPMTSDRHEMPRTRGRSASVAESRSVYGFSGDSPRSTSSEPQNLMIYPRTSAPTSPRTNDSTSPRSGIKISSSPTSPRGGISSPRPTRERSKTRDIIMFNPSVAEQ